MNAYTAETKDILTKDQAIEILRAHAFCDDDPESLNFGRITIHCFSGRFGCDWDLHEAVAAVEKSPLVCWQSPICGHARAVQDGIKFLLFDVPLPERK